MSKVYGLAERGYGATTVEVTPTADGHMALEVSDPAAGAVRVILAADVARRLGGQLMTADG